MLRSWLDTWAGVGHILDARSADGYYVELRQSVFEFYREAMHHSHIGPARVAGNDPRRAPFFTWRNAGTLCQFAKARQQASAQSLACHESADNHLERLSAPVTSETTPCVDPHKTQGAGDGRVSDTARAIVANVSPTISGVISSLVLIHNGIRMRRESNPQHTPDIRPSRESLHCPSDSSRHTCRHFTWRSMGTLVSKTSCST
jgi:hypothetical protein